MKKYHFKIRGGDFTVAARSLDEADDAIRLQYGLSAILHRKLLTITKPC